MKKLIKGVAVILLAVQIVTFSGCSTASKSFASHSEGYGNVTNGTARSADMGVDYSAEDSQKATSTSTSTSKLSAATSRKIVKSATISLKTTTYDKSVAALENAVDNYGGFVQSSTTQGEVKAGTRTASFTVRVPTAKFSTFLDSVGKVGKIVSRSVNGKDISEDYLDTKTRLDTLETEHSRLVKLLSVATKMSDILAIEEKLTSVETSIEEYTGELKKWDSLVDLSTVNIRLTETKKSVAKTDTFAGTVSYVFSQSIGALVTTAKTICYCIVAIVPFAVILAILFGIILLILRRRKKHGKRKIVAEHKTGSDDEDHNDISNK